jgi:hypothetical protein
MQHRESRSTTKLRASGVSATHDCIGNATNAPSQYHGSSWTGGQGRFVISIVAVDLEHSMEPDEMLLRVSCATIRGIEVNHRGRRRAAPWSITHSVTPSGRPGFVSGCGPAPAAACRHRRPLALPSRSRAEVSAAVASHRQLPADRPQHLNHVLLFVSRDIAC